MESWKKAGKGRELAWIWQGEEPETKKPLVVCLAESEGAAEQCLKRMAEGKSGAMLSAVVLPDGDMDAWEEELGAHRPQRFSAVCVVGGHTDPYCAPLFLVWCTKYTLCYTHILE